SCRRKASGLSSQYRSWNSRDQRGNRDGRLASTAAGSSERRCGDHWKAGWAIFNGAEGSMGAAGGHLEFVVGSGGRFVITAPARNEIECFRDLLVERVGLHFEDGKLEFLGDVLRKRMEETQCGNFWLYRERVSSPGCGRAEIGALAAQLTVG